ncbi:glycosyltransferase family 39 protein [Micromonospora lupini]|uniref:ArnT family glycosyltransferase n=1 Tax=Micromonospora lupini TaxID=285679 RepID=UPI002254D4F5|nr:glycosyltransferase family 39 protein [Micromonospora lupini]MCX5065965.1 glycosyltransferase family 39 protein [Micromonospora lupini]
MGRDPSDDRLPTLVWVIAAAFVAIELAFSAGYGFQQDELYFIQAGRHLAFGYVDQPPLAPLLTRLATMIGGTHPTAVRTLPALEGGAIIVLAARQAVIFGAGRVGRVLAALCMAGAPVLLGAVHIGNTTPPALLAWTLVVLCVSTAIARDRPRWWLGAGLAAGLGLQTNNLVALLLLALAVGLLATRRFDILRTRWPWLAAAIAAIIWAPNVVWQATHGWPQLTMAASLHRANTSLADYQAGLPAQLVYGGLFTAPVLIAGVVRLWRTTEERYLAVTVTLVVVYVLAWTPGKPYYTSGLLPAVLAAGAVATERWFARGRRPVGRRALVVGAILVATVVSLPSVLPVWPVRDLSAHPTSSDLADMVGWPQLAGFVAAENTALASSGTPPTSIFTDNYAEAATLDVLGPPGLPPVLSGHNAYGMWGPGSASDTTVLAVDAADQLRPYFAQCLTVGTFVTPYDVDNDFNHLDLSLCTGPMTDWVGLWPHLRHDE